MAFIQSMQVSTDDRDTLLALAAEDDGLGESSRWLINGYSRAKLMITAIAL